MSVVRIVPRGLTACVDAYLTPGIKEYIRSFQSGFDEGIKDKVRVSFMQSDGGLTPANQFRLIYRPPPSVKIKIVVQAIHSVQ